MHGARGVLESVVQAYPETDLDIHVVWVPMLDSDNESAAREISGMFDDPRVHQYWDPKRRSGTSYSAHVFPTYLADIHKGLDATLPADHWWREQKRDWKAVKPENAPLWDVAFLYDAGAKWDEHPPTPRDTVKQVFFYGPQSNGKSGMFCSGFKKPPLDTDWAVELAKAMTKLTGRKPKTPPQKDTSLSSGPSDAAGCAGGAVRAELLVLEVKGLVDGSTADDVAQALGAIKGVMRATADIDSNLVQLLVDAGSSVTADRAVEFLALAGYEAKEASEKQYDQVTSALASGGAIVIRNPADQQADETRDADKKIGTKSDSLQSELTSSVELTSLAKSLEPLRAHFNANKNKHRFVALLSPT